MVHEGLVLRRQAMEGTANDAVYVIVLTSVSDIAVTARVLETEGPPKLPEPLATGRHQYSAVFATIKLRNWILLDLHNYSSNDASILSVSLALMTALFTAWIDGASMFLSLADKARMNESVVSGE